MSGGGSTNAMSGALIAPKMSVIGNAIIGKNSLMMPRGYNATTPINTDNTVWIYQTNGVVAPTIGATRGTSSELVFALPKNSTLVGECYLENIMLGGTAGAGVTCEYVKNAGDLLARDVTVQYGNTQLLRYDADLQVFFRRLCKNDVNIEDINSTVLGNLPPSTAAAGTEAVLRDAWLNGCTFITPLEELFWVHAKDEAWMPESLALEGQLRIQLAAWPDLMMTSTGTGAVPADVAVFPLVSSCKLRYIEYTLSAAEKQNRLAIYKTPEGLVQKFLDVETQLGIQWTGLNVARAAYALGANNLNAQALVDVTPIQLSNFRLDMAEIWFVVRRLSNSDTASYPDEAGIIGPGFRGSRYESNQSNSLVTGAPISTMVQIEEFSFNANGKTIFVAQSDLYNRTYVRKYYHPDAQVADPVYCIPLALFPEDRRNATGHLSASVLGNLTVNIRLRDPGNDIVYQIDFYDHSHNLLQSRAGSITKALH